MHGRTFPPSLRDSSAWLWFSQTTDTALSECFLARKQPECSSTARGLQLFVWTPCFHANLIPALSSLPSNSSQLIIKEKEPICSPGVFAALFVSLWDEYSFAHSVEEMIWNSQRYKVGKYWMPESGVCVRGACLWNTQLEAGVQETVTFSFSLQTTETAL